ncbi:hypothetical protein Voc01_025470 [Virgisporangium ochraceum]|uniref:Uncharacterized protein n=1 Tax=Virgisporangium ochraceum TaxID=65505 RepID=A0A8J4E9U4_9ACTN|nr:hypothetical protein Voc01_025470 [Virgisporangium ochraceum]
MEGVAVGLAAVVAMAAVAMVGARMAAPEAGTVGAGAAVVALAVGAPVDLTVSGTAVPGSDRLPVRGGVPVTVDGTVDVRPLGVTLAGVAVLVLAFRWRRLSWAGAGGALVGFVAGTGACARFGTGGPVDVGRAAVVFRADAGSAVSGALVLAVVVLGACLLPPWWRRPFGVVAAVLGGLALLGTVVGTVVGAVAGGMRSAGVGLLAGADAVALVPWGLGVPWRADVVGPLAGPLAERFGEVLPHHGGRWGVAVVGPVAVLSMGVLTTERGWPAAARLGAAVAAGFAGVTVATAATATATATVFVVRLPAMEMALRGTVFVAVLVGAVAGTIAGLVPWPFRVPSPFRVRTHGVPPRRR